MRLGARTVIVSVILPAAALGLIILGSGPASSDPAPQTAKASAFVAAPSNRAPVISVAGLPDAEVGREFRFQAAASDPDGDALRFSAQNLPPWAHIDTATGRISGTPDAADVGAYEAITVTATDATRSVVTAPFTITVLAEPVTPRAMVATLQWERPLSKLDGSPLDDLAGYRILYGRNSEDLDQSVFVMNPDTTRYDFPALESGIWYFAIVAVASNGLEGPATPPAMKSI